MLPDLLLLDVIMPGTDGVQLLQELKADARWRDIPVLMVSSLSPDEMTEKTFGLGAADFIRKPFRPRELIARVHAQLRMRRELATTQRALRSAEEELQRAREDAESRRKVVDILHEVTGDLSSDEIYHILARRVARALSLSRCSVILAKPGDKVGIVATAFDNPALRNFEIHLDRYPEIRSGARARATRCSSRTCRAIALYADIRKEWQANGTLVPVRSVIALPFTLGKAQAGVFFLRRMANEPPLTNDDVEFADAVIKAAVAAIHRAQLIETTKADNARLEVLAHTDPLTQVLNRRALTVRLSSEMERAKRYDSVITLLMLDLDHFKGINDTSGHLVGDDVLREVAALLQESDPQRRHRRALRRRGVRGGAAGDALARRGDVCRAHARAEWTRTVFTPAHGGVHLTASIGVASYPARGCRGVDDLFARADEALYRAKAAGRNKVCTVSTRCPSCGYGLRRRREVLHQGRRAADAVRPERGAPDRRRAQNTPADRA